MRAGHHLRRQALRGPLFWALLGATCVVYLAMLAWTLPEIQRAADGLVPFDMRPLVYDAAAARALLSALTPEGRALYLGPQQRLDLLFPALLAATLGVALWRLAPPRPRALRAALVALPFAAAVCDYVENARVRAMLLTGPDAVGAEVVAAASRATVAKSALSTVALLVLLTLLAVCGMRRLRARSGT